MQIDDIVELEDGTFDLTSNLTKEEILMYLSVGANYLASVALRMLDEQLIEDEGDEYIYGEEPVDEEEDDPSGKLH